MVTSSDFRPQKRKKFDVDAYLPASQIRKFRKLEKEMIMKKMLYHRARVYDEKIEKALPKIGRTKPSKRYDIYYFHKDKLIRSARITVG